MAKLHIVLLRPEQNIISFWCISTDLKWCVPRHTHITYTYIYEYVYRKRLCLTHDRCICVRCTFTHLHTIHSIRGTWKRKETLFCCFFLLFIIIIIISVLFFICLFVAATAATVIFDVITVALYVIIASTVHVSLWSLVSASNIIFVCVLPFFS